MTFRHALLAACALGAASLAGAHHSPAMFDMTTTVVIAGMAMIGLLGACIDFCLRGLELHISRNWGR